MKNLKGYVFSRPISNNIIPQKIQNIILRDYCVKNNYNFLISSIEYTMNKCHYVLDGLIKNIIKYDGYVAYSVFQLPENSFKRKKILTKVLKKNKEFHFVLENIIISKKNKKNLKFIENIISIKNIIKKNNKNYKKLKIKINSK
jgi:sporadic carbohydrate cluster protein (TIGR04323 family)